MTNTFKEFTLPGELNHPQILGLTDPYDGTYKEIEFAWEAIHFCIASVLSYPDAKIPEKRREEIKTFVINEAKKLDGNYKTEIAFAVLQDCSISVRNRYGSAAAIIDQWFDGIAGFAR